MVISSSNNNNNEVILSDDEIDVANVLLDLPYLITNTLSSYRLSYDWGSKKRRSALVFPPSYSPPRCRRKVSAQLPPPPPPVKAEACSPNTPLSFSPSESDSNEYHHQTPLIPSYDQRSPLISTFFQSNGGGNNWVHASPLHHQLNSGNNWGLQFQQYHNQSQPLILNHHGMVNDPVYAVAASGAMQMHCPAPLIPRHQNQRLLPDLNMEYKDQDQVCRERRAARLQANKEKRPRVNPAVK
uniref:Uncharacterized protein n=1 Tax=Chenopodium quinoa TaxID=63459 RepID=A0A803MRK0_CHEQI